jgi:predicted nuclease with RNAse H fold
MSQSIQTVVGIDVGGERKGFHAVALRGASFVDKTTVNDPALIVDWCLGHKATVVAVDAPCGWSQARSSRFAESELVLLGKKLLSDAYS